MDALHFWSLEFWARWLAIVLIDLSLAGDNALVIALAVRSLPPREQFIGRIGGSLGAVLLRLIFIAIISQLLLVPFLRAVGGVALIWIAFRLVRQDAGGEAGGPHGEGKVRQGATLREAIWIIILADVIMSLDNVLAVADAAQGHFVLVAFGIGLSIPIVIWGSGLLARLMRSGAELRLATDDPSYLPWMVEHACLHPTFIWLAERPVDWRERPADWPPTRYERKMLAGRKPAFLILRRR